MKIVFRSFYIKCGVPFVILLFFIFGFLFHYNFQRQREWLKDEFLKDGEILVLNGSEIISQEMEEKDDLAIINYVQKLVERKNVLSSMLIDPNGKVLAHDRPSEIGKIYDDRFTKTILKTNELKIYRSISEHPPYERVYKFSIPIFSNNKKSGYLRVVVSFEEVAEKIRRLKEELLLLYGITFLILSCIIFLVIHGIISPLRKTTEIIDGISSGKYLPKDIEIKRKDEFGSLINVVKNFMSSYDARSSHLRDEISRWSEKFKQYLKNLGTFFSKGVLLTDRENNLVYINQLMRDKLLIEPDSKIIGKHILEVIKNVELLGLLKEAFSNPNKLITGEIKSLKMNAKILCVKDERDELVGSIVGYE